jgi:hypothetical protein
MAERDRETSNQGASDPVALDRPGLSARGDRYHHHRIGQCWGTQRLTKKTMENAEDKENKDFQRIANKLIASGDHKRSRAVHRQ